MALSTFLRISVPFAAMGFVNQASRAMVATVGPAMAVEFGLSASGLGALAAMFFAAYALFQLPVGLLIDLRGARWVQIRLALVSALGFALCAFAADPAMLAIGRFVTGLGVAGALIGLMKANMQWFPRERLAAVTGAGVFVGAAGSLAASAPLQAVLPLIGWRGGFALLAALSCATSLWIALSVPQQAPGMPRVKRRLGLEIAEFGRIFRHPVFTRNMPAMALLAGLVFTYQGLWLGPWLRDVAGLDGEARGLVLLCFSLGIMFGQLLGGQLASALQARGIDAMRVPFFGIGLMAVAQALLIWAPQGDAMGIAGLGVLWFGFAYAGSCGPVAYAVLSQRFPAELTARVTTALNFSMLTLVFLLQNVIGWVLDLFPRTDTGGWDPAGYGWAIGLTLALQALTVLWLVVGPRPREGDA